MLPSHRQLATLAVTCAPGLLARLALPVYVLAAWETAKETAGLPVGDSNLAQVLCSTQYNIDAHVVVHEPYLL